jgi:hypothetical protein
MMTLRVIPSAARDLQFLAVVAAVALSVPAHAQSLPEFRAGLNGVYVNQTEMNATHRASGFGFGGLLAAQRGRFGLELSGYTASLDPKDAQSGLTGYSVKQGDVRASMLVVPNVAIQVGAGRRSVSPDLAAQEVGFVRVGLASENRLTNIADLRVRGAYLVAPHFSGGGTAGLAFEIGLGVGVGPQSGRVRFQTDYDFQRIDREVNGSAVPMQSLVARAGAVVRL